MSSRRLVKLLAFGTLSVNDVLRFDFKSNIFSATITEGGVLHKCHWKNPQGLLLTVLKGKTFMSLSDWTECCIQEILHEFSTRYSSWKRVYHTKSGKTLDELWKLYNEKKLSDIKKPSIDQLRQINDRLMERLAKANEKIEDLTSSSEGAVRPIIMDSPHGTYMVLQRMIQTDHPHLQHLKENGLSDFRKHLTEFSKHPSLPPVEDGSMCESHAWFEEAKKTSPQDSLSVAKFVHDFFVHDHKRKGTMMERESADCKRIKI